mmetsp:Transcript_62733/g.181830  ORF Transcript_62733/g.181830 Transcript_62733/m.181830 type:complete len:265 (+) Transcript_62733:1028-1822(+)
MPSSKAMIASSMASWTSLAWGQCVPWMSSILRLALQAFSTKERLQSLRAFVAESGGFTTNCMRGVTGQLAGPKIGECEGVDVSGFNKNCVEGVAGQLVGPELGEQSGVGLDAETMKAGGNANGLPGGVELSWLSSLWLREPPDVLGESCRFKESPFPESSGSRAPTPPAREPAATSPRAETSAQSSSSAPRRSLGTPPVSAASSVSCGANGGAGACFDLRPARSLKWLDSRLSAWPSPAHEWAARKNSPWPSCTTAASARAIGS